MTPYHDLDQRILAAIRAQKNPLYARVVSEEATRLADALGREAFRVIDGRLQALRKAGKIRHVTKAEGSDKNGWQVVPRATDPGPDEKTAQHPEVKAFS